jgi:hypothetical protein
MRRVRVITVAVEKQQVLHILGVCIPALIVRHVMRIFSAQLYLWPAPLCHIFPHMIFLRYLSGISRASFLRSCILSSAACAALPYFSNLIPYTALFSGKSYWTQNIF